jgi:hypothetical protein
MQDYIDAQSGGRGRGWFRLVYDPGQARKAIERGQLAVLIGVESSNPFGCSEFLGVALCGRGEIERGIRIFRGLGIRAMFPLHWVDNAFGGAALEGGAQGTFIGAMNVEQTGQPFQTQLCSRADEVEQEDGMRCNTRGLTPLGAYLIRRLIAHHMLIEADHMSERTRNAVLTLAEENDYPLVSSHTGTGGSWSAAQLRRLYALGGVASATPEPAPQLARKVMRLRRYRNLSSFFGVGLGTDTGGLGAQPGARADAAQDPLHYPFRSYDRQVRFFRQRTGQRTFDLNRDGVAEYGLNVDLLADVQRRRATRPALNPMFRAAEAYLRMWQRAASHH